MARRCCQAPKMFRRYGTRQVQGISTRVEGNEEHRATMIMIVRTKVRGESLGIIVEVARTRDDTRDRTCTTRTVVKSIHHTYTDDVIYQKCDASEM